MPFSWIYGKIADFKNTLFDGGRLPSFPLGAPTVSVGNITFGGTGKTPFVAHVAELLAADGARVAVLTRGYKRADERRRVLVSDFEGILADVAAAGDEPLELARRLLGRAVVVADADRVAAARWARERFGVTAFVLDDGFQHRRARRTLDIVLIDATDPFGRSRARFFTRLREPLENLRRADLLVVTRADLVAPEKLAQIRERLARLNPSAPILTAVNRFSGLAALEAASPPAVSDTATAPALAFCGIGNPDNFFELLRHENFTLAATRRFPDHHRYGPADAAALEAEARRAGAEILLTTAKDAVKLTGLNFGLPGFVVESRTQIDDEKRLREMLRAALESSGDFPV